TFGIAPLAIFTGWFLARKEFRGKVLLETAILLPMVMPPVATGFILLNLLATHGPLGWLTTRVFSQTLLLTSWAAALASAIVAFPFFVRSAQVAFAAAPKNLEHVAMTMGKSRWQVFWRVSLPLAKGGVVYGWILAF